MGNREWLDDWEVGNEAAWGCLAVPIAIGIGALIGLLLRNLI